MILRKIRKEWELRKKEKESKSEYGFEPFLSDKIREMGEAEGKLIKLNLYFLSPFDFMDAYTFTHMRIGLNCRIICQF
jgi:hypothetical protein